MWIQLDCPNGHPVKVEGKYAGRIGRCPACGTKVRIPLPAPSQAATEQAILDILGPGPSTAAPLSSGPKSSGPKPAPVVAPPAEPDHSHVLDESSVAEKSGSSTSVNLGQPTRVCPSCRKKVSVRYQICPHCRTYMPIASVSPAPGGGSVIMRGQPSITNCSGCGARSFPGATVCNNCGEPL